MSGGKDGRISLIEVPIFRGKWNARFMQQFTAMNDRLLIAVIMLAIACSSLPSPALSAPRYPLEGLLRRAKHVLIVNLTSRTSTNVTFQITKVLRGDDKLKTITLDHTVSDHEFFRGTEGLLLFSQGDNYTGEPKSVLRIHQPMKGQASYCGWILEGVPAGGTNDLERLREIVKKAPYEPDKYGKAHQ